MIPSRFGITIHDNIPMHFNTDPVLFTNDYAHFHLRKDAALQALFFTQSGDATCIADASYEDWITFLESVGYNITDYSESPIVPALRRCDVANELIREGRLRANLDISPYPWEKPLILLEKAQEIMTCQDLAREGSWDRSLCCQDCHKNGDLIKSISRNRELRLCCAADRLIEDYGPDRDFHHLNHED